jgi:signal transduction histidine kinase
MDPTPTRLTAPQLARLVEISRTLNSKTDLKELLTYIIKEAADIMNMEAASILLFDSYSRQLNFAASSGEIVSQLADTPIPLDGSIAGMIFQENGPVHIPDVSTDARWNQQVDKTIDFETREILGVPMHNAEQRPIGVLEAINKLSGQVDSNDIEMLSALADLAGVAVEKARLIEELSELDQLKTDFIAIASHELRTPLAIMLGYLSYLREEAPANMAGHLDSVLRAANRLRNLIQEMLNFQYTDADAKSLHLARIDLVTLARNVCQEKMEAALAKDHQVDLQFPRDPLWAFVDAATIEVAYGNLIDNAIRFTPEGGQITIRIERQQQEAWLTIADDGIGIARDKQERIFKRFYQVEPHMSRRHEGLGLGLAVAKELVELQQGRIWVESRLHEGSKFYVSLPLQEQ